MTKNDTDKKIETIDITDNIGEGTQEVQAILAGNHSDLSDAIPSLYQTVNETLNNDTRLSKEQTDYLASFEEAVGVFKEMSKVLRVETDVHTLEDLVAAKQELLSTFTQLHDTLEPREVFTPGATGETMSSKDRENMFNKLKENKGKKSKPADAKQEKDAPQPTDADFQHALKEVTDLKFFANRYALAFAGNVGLSLLDEKKKETPKVFNFNEEYNVSKDGVLLSSLLATSTQEKIIESTDGVTLEKVEERDKHLKDILSNVFTTWVNQYDHNTFKHVIDSFNVDEVKVKYDNFTIANGLFKKKNDVVRVDGFMPVTKDDIIGSAEFDKTIWTALLKLSCYDFDRKENPLHPPYSVFTYSEPGLGKTFVVHANVNSFAQLCREKGIPLDASVFSTTDFATKYQNDSANRLKEKAMDIKNFQGLVIRYVPDADNVHRSRQDDDLSPDAAQAVGVMFGMFDGTIIPKDGKTMWFQDANYIDSIDEASKDRMFDLQAELKRYDDPRHFAEYAQRMINGKKKDFWIKPKHMLEVGELLLESGLSLRSAGNAIRGLYTDMPIDEGITDMLFDDIKAMEYNYMRQTVTRDSIVNSINDYVTTRVEMEEKAIKDKQNKKHEIFKEFLQKKADPSKGSK